MRRIVAHTGPAHAPSLAPVRPGVVARRDLFQRLEQAGRVVEISAPPGSGKTFLLQSWIVENGLQDRVAWVLVHREEHDAQRFWLSVLDALRRTSAGSTRVRELTAAPGLDTGEITERLLQDLDSLEDPVWLVIDDLHELRSPEALRQLELLLMRAPPELRFALVTRHDLRLGLHRLRVEGGLTEIRATDLRFSRDQAQELFHMAGVQLSESAVARLHERTEGWAAGLRLAALSLSGHPDPERFAAEFSGSERTVAEYLVAEVLERQPEEVRRLLLRTSILRRVNGPLADHLTGGDGGARILQELEAGNAFVVAVDAAREWFRYHGLFADLLALELRRTAPNEIPVLHELATGWYAEHGHPVEAIRHAQAAENWGLATRLLSDHWLSLRLDGRGAAAHALMSGFPSSVMRGDAEFLALLAVDQGDHGSLEEAQRYLDLATQAAGQVQPERREQFELQLAVRRLRLARVRGDLTAAIDEAQQLLGSEATPHFELSAEQRGYGLMQLGIAESFAGRNEEAEGHLEQGVVLARQLGRPYLELVGLAHGARIAVLRSYVVGAERSREAIALAQRHGWGEEPLAGVAYAQLAGALVSQGHLDEADRWLERAERTLRAERDPASGVSLRWSRGSFEMARGNFQRALDAFRDAERLAGMLVTGYVDAWAMRAQTLQAQVGLGQTENVAASLAAMEETDRHRPVMRNVMAALQLARDDPQGALATLEPALADPGEWEHPIWQVEGHLLEAMARDAQGEADAARVALERALELAEPDCVRLPFFVHPVRDLLERHPGHQTSHASLVTELMGLLAGIPATREAPPDRLPEPLSEAEIRVLRYLPTHLSLREIGNELYVSVHTIKTHSKHIYDKLNVHGRADAVERARSNGLLAPSARGR